jgi:predicted adenine nucleotide alpha hydrolase (AANH) superfamily ATPase
MNNVNFDAVMTDTINGLGVRLPKLLLHVCCAPCATYCLTQLVEYFDVTMLYANDNIVDVEEWEKRLGEVRKLVGYVNDGLLGVVPAAEVGLIVAEYDHNKFFEAVKGFMEDAEGSKRCYLCIEQRLKLTADVVKREGYEYFATTLSVSPHKNSQWINEIGLRLAGEMYLPTDFKKRGGFNKSVALSEKLGLYRQSFCGCRG